MLKRLLRTDSYPKGVALSTIASVGSKALSFCVNLSIAYFFGAGTETDIYFFCFSTITLMSWFITSLNNTVVIPHSMHLAVQEGTETSTRFTNTFLLFITVATGLVAALALISPARLCSMISRFPLGELVAHDQIIQLFLLALVPIVISTVLCDILFAQKFFILPMMMSASSWVFCLFSIAFLHNAIGLLCLPLAMMVASSLQIPFLLILMKRLLGWNFSQITFNIRRLAIQNSGFALIGNITTVISTFVPTMLMSGFAGGTLTALTYAQNAASIPATLVTTQYSAVTGIRLNEVFAARDTSAANRVFLMSLKFLLFVLIPISCLMAVFSKEIITILFHRGALDIATVISSSQFLVYLSFLCPLLAINTLVSRLFIAEQKIFLAIMYQAAMNILLTIMIIIFVNLLGPKGYPISQLALYGIGALALFWVMKFAFPFVQYAEILKYSAKLLVLNVPLMTGALFLKKISCMTPITVQILFVSVVYASILILLNAKYRFNENVHQIMLWLVRKG